MPQLGISLFNFGLFTYVNGMLSCGWRKLAQILFLRFVASPLCCLSVLLMFGNFSKDLMKLLVLSAAMPQALSSFVVFKEWKIQPEVFSTSMTVGTALCLPITCLWYFLLDNFL
jgi:auxin efflux carrier family protein